MLLQMLSTNSISLRQLYMLLDYKKLGFPYAESKFFHLPELINLTIAIKIKKMIVYYVFLDNQHTFQTTININFILKNYLEMEE